MLLLVLFVHLHLIKKYNMKFKTHILLSILTLSVIFSSCKEEEEVVTPQNNATARVQVIHNCADLAATSVDIYLNNDLLIDNFNFRTASPFIDAPANEEFSVSVAPSTSASSSEALVTYNFTLTEGGTYVLIADGIISPTGYSPSKAFSIEVYPMGREVASYATNTDLLIHHGSTDAPTVDVVETGVGAGTIVDNASYKDFTDYLELPTSDYTLDIRDASGAITVATFSAPLATLNLMGMSAVVVASGFLDPTSNSNGESFGLYVALPAGGALVALPAGKK
jgi:hypothetical protein